MHHRQGKLRSGARWPAILLLLCLIWACDVLDTPAVPTDPKIRTTPTRILKETESTLWWRLPDGETALLPKRPRRTVILLTSLLDLWHEAGGTAIARCAGKTNLPPGGDKIPVVGTFNNPNIEKIIALRPDLVISSDVGNFRALIPILKQNRIPYAYFNYINYHDYVHILELFAKLNGTEVRFQTIHDALTREVAAVVSRAQNRPAPKVLVVFSTSNSVSCELPNSQTGTMISMLGAVNIIPEQYHSKQKTRISFSLERIVQLDPDIILLNTMGKVAECRERIRKEFESNEAWSTLRAIRNQRFHVLPKEYFLYKANARFPEALSYLADILYPEPGKVETVARPAAETEKGA